jgi:hypothetical protein
VIGVPEVVGLLGMKAQRLRHVEASGAYAVFTIDDQEI